MAKATRRRVRRSATRKTKTPVRKPRVDALSAAKARYEQKLEGLRGRAQTLGHDLRLARQEARQALFELTRLRGIEEEAAALRREIGPQRPLLQAPETPPSTARDPWVPALVESHLIALHDHDVAALDAILAPDIVVTEAAFPEATRRGRAEAMAFHADLFATWTDFRFMPRHWHNLGGAAFLEGEASFMQRGVWHGISANGKLVNIDMLLIYHLSEDRISRIKLYYDAASVRRQVAAPGTQGELF